MQNDSEATNKSFITVLAVFPLVLFHFFAAIFLSFLADWSEFSLMTLEKTLKNEISLKEVNYLLIEYLPFYFPYLLTKVLLFFVPKSALHSGFIHIRDALLLTLTSFAIPLAILKLSELYTLNQNAASFYGISFFLFVPWPIFLDRDAFGHKEDKVPLIEATQQFPVKVIEKGTRGWGILIMTFSLIFISVSLFGFSKQFEFQILTALIFFVPFFLVGSIFFLIGLNLQWAKKEVTITREDVSGHMRLFLPWPKTIYWRQPLIDYRPPSKEIHCHRGDTDDGSQTIYEIKMNLKTSQPKKKFSFHPSLDIILYKAYHPEDLDKKLTQYSQLFSFMEKQ